MTENSAHGKRLNLYISSPQACDYLVDKSAQSIFIAPDLTMTPGIYEYLISIGFRRSGQHVYRPNCPACRACISTRIDAQKFTPSRSQKRILQKNSDLTFTPVEANFYPEHYDLYMKYQQYKHSGGSMEQFSIKDYQAFLCDSFGNGIMYETRIGKKLLAVSVTDVFTNALSAVYTFFDPNFSSKSLGTYSILQQIEAAKIQQKEHLYLGYFIRDSHKMSYKTNFRPIELLLKGQWISLNKGTQPPQQSDSLDSPLTF